MTAPVLSSTAKSRSSTRHSDKTVALKSNSVPTSPFCRAVDSSAAVVKTAKMIGVEITNKHYIKSVLLFRIPHMRECGYR